MQGAPGEGHIAIGQEVLAGKGIVPQHDADVYAQMFRLKFVRVVEHEDGRVELVDKGNVRRNARRAAPRRSGVDPT